MYTLVRVSVLTGLKGPAGEDVLGKTPQTKYPDLCDSFIAGPVLVSGLLIALATALPASSYADADARKFYERHPIAAR
jgi:hypothetical protein